MKMTLEGIRDAAAWEKARVKLPGFDIEAMRRATAEAPVWVHFGAGNIFRGFIAVLQQRLLQQGLEKSGIVAAETFDFDIIDRIYAPYDNLTMAVSLRPDGSMEKEIAAGIAEGVKADMGDARSFGHLKHIFAQPSLQMISFTITEKGYALTDLKGNFLPAAAKDLENGPGAACHAMGVAAALLLERYRTCRAPLAVVSMDNCSHNGEKLRAGIVTVAEEWEKRGHVTADFVKWLTDEEIISFPWTMIDKITPRPAKEVEEALAAAGIEGMTPIVTGRNTYIAPFVNAEVPQYLVVEDRFPNGRPALEKAGVYMTDRETVNRTERMKVTTCLNPLHTSLAVYGCLLGYDRIFAEMKDPDLKRLVEIVGYEEGMPVVTHPGIIDPMRFIHEVIDERLPNPFIPDMPQRIATDTSQKIPVRFGETIKAYLAGSSGSGAAGDRAAVRRAADTDISAGETLSVKRDDSAGEDPGVETDSSVRETPDVKADGTAGGTEAGLRDVRSLTAIPLVIAGWLRYLLAVDDNGQPMELSSDPMLEKLQGQLAGITFGAPESAEGKLEPVLSNPVLFGTDLVKAGLAPKIGTMFKELLAGPGAVRGTLHRYVSGER